MERQRRRVTAALFLSLLLLWGTFEAQPVFIDSLLRTFGWSHAQVSWIAAVSSLGIGVVGPLAGQLLDRFDARYIMGIGALMVGSGLLSSAFCHGFASLMVATALYSVGLGASTVLPASMVIANWYDHRRRGAALGITLSGMEIGGMFFTLAAGVLIAAKGLRAGYVLAGAPAILIAAPLLLVAVRTRPAPIGAALQAVELPGLQLYQAVRTPVFWALAGVQTASGLLIGGLFPFLVSFFIELGYQASVAVIVVTAAYGCVIIGKPLLGLLTDRAGGRAALIVGFFCWSMVAVGLMAASRTWSALVFLGFIGFALPAAIAVVPAIVATSLGLKQFGAIYGCLAIGNTAGLFLGPLAIGALADVSGSYAVAFRLLLGVAVVGAASACFCGGAARSTTSGIAHA